MKVKKTISEKVLEANRRNARKSSGPKTTSGKGAVAHNAVIHGLLAKRIVFQNEEEKAEFNLLQDQLVEEMQPAGVLEQMLVEDIAVRLWKLHIAEGWELEDIRNRREGSKKLVEIFIKKSEHEELFPGNGGKALAGLGWDCREAVVTASSRNREKEGGIGEQDEEEKTGRAEMELRLTSSVETILRYETTLKRELARTIQILHAVQDRRNAASAS